MDGVSEFGSNPPLTSLVSSSGNQVLLLCIWSIPCHCFGMGPELEWAGQLCVNRWSEGNGKDKQE